MIVSNKSRSQSRATTSSKGLNQKAYETIKKEIVEGDLIPGTLVTENELSSKLGISRTPIREALHRLESDRFIKIYPRRGILIPDISLKDIQDLYSIRAVMEPFAVRLATKRIKSGDLKHYQSIFSTERHIKTPKDLLEIDRDFHLMIVKNTNNDYLISLMLKFYDHLQRVRNIIGDRIFEVKEITYKEHLDIIKSILKREEKKAEDAMQTHLKNAFERMSESFSIE